MFAWPDTKSTAEAVSLGSKSHDKTNLSLGSAKAQDLQRPNLKAIA
jgi:hypothetical protein